MKVLLAEDDEQLARKLLRVLHGHGFAVDHADNGEDALHLACTGVYDVIVLDLGLPVIDGLAALQGLRGRGVDFPVLILTARDAWADKSAGFKAGADDYLTKPFLPDELVLRMRALVRRARGLKAETLRCGPLGYDPITGGFELNSAPLRLTAFETRILARLMLFREHVVEREKLFDATYEFQADVPQNSLEVLVGRLRRKIGHHMIETVRGHGYRLTAQNA